MSNDYQIGLSVGTMVNLIEDPWSRLSTEQVGFTLAGDPINVALDTIIWTWQNMNQETWNQIWEFWVDNILDANPPPDIYIKSLQNQGEQFYYGTFKCRMGKPSSEVTKAISQIRDAEVRFYQVEQVA